MKKVDKNKDELNFVCLDEVTDPRNIGSIIRSAASFNIDGIIVKERSYPGESKLLFKSASGCTELINIFEVSNINTTLKYLKSKNFWVSGFDGNAEKDFTKHNWKGNNVFSICEYDRCNGSGRFQINFILTLLSLYLLMKL